MRSRDAKARWTDNERAASPGQKFSKNPDRLPKEDIKFLREFSGWGGLIPVNSGGQFYTPKVVSDFLTSMLRLDRRIKLSPTKTEKTSSSISKHFKLPHVLDAGCGTGGLSEDMTVYAKVTGVDIHKTSINIARAVHYGEVRYEYICEDFMEYDFGLTRFDYVVSNPPFNSGVYSCNIGTPKLKKLKSESSFLYKAVNLTKPGGYIGFIVPDGVLNNSALKDFRQWLLSMCRLCAVVSLPTETFYHTGTSVKTSVIVLQRLTADALKAVGDYSIFMGICDHVGWDSRGRATGKNDLPLMELCYHHGKVGAALMLAKNKKEGLKKK